MSDDGMYIDLSLYRPPNRKQRRHYKKKMKVEIVGHEEQMGS